jgi:hypothetical protein
MLRIQANGGARQSQQCTAVAATAASPPAACMQRLSCRGLCDSPPRLVLASLDPANMLPRPQEDLEIIATWPPPQPLGVEWKLLERGSWRGVPFRHFEGTFRWAPGDRGTRRPWAAGTIACANCIPGAMLAYAPRPAFGHAR